MKSRAHLQLVRKLDPAGELAVTQLDPIITASKLEYKFGAELVAAILAQNTEVGRLYVMVGNLCSAMQRRGYQPDEIHDGVLYAALKLSREGKP